MVPYPLPIYAEEILTAIGSSKVQMASNMWHCVSHKADEEDSKVSGEYAFSVSLGCDKVCGHLKAWVVYDKLAPDAEEGDDIGGILYPLWECSHWT